MVCISTENSKYHHSVRVIAEVIFTRLDEVIFWVTDVTSLITVGVFTLHSNDYANQRKNHSLSGFSDISDFYYVLCTAIFEFVVGLVVDICVP